MNAQITLTIAISMRYASITTALSLASVRTAISETVVSVKVREYHQPMYSLLNLHPLKDFDECGVHVDNCSLHATCSNTEGSFNCTCNEGYVGSGVICEGIFCIFYQKGKSEQRKLKAKSEK